jgi:hypothetical protein
MNLRNSDATESRFATYVGGLVGVIGHADRNGPLRDYCVGLMLPNERKSVEPMAARTAPARASAQHQKLLHFAGVAAWSNEKVSAKVRALRGTITHYAGRTASKATGFCIWSINHPVNTRTTACLATEDTEDCNERQRRGSVFSRP